MSGVAIEGMGGGKKAIGGGMIDALEGTRDWNMIEGVAVNRVSVAGRC